MNALCFTVEIDKKHFPEADKYIYNLIGDKVRFTSNKFDNKYNTNQCLCCRFDFDENSVSKVSTSLAEIIKLDYLPAYADSIIKNNYIGIDKSERKSIVSDTTKSIDVSCLGDMIKNFIVQNRHLHLGGFVLFRIKDFLQCFENKIDSAIDEFNEQQRYRNFVELLKFFVDIQEIECDTINLVIKDNERYEILDKYGEPLNDDLLDSTHCEISAFEKGDSYLMINDLISLAPRQIIIHCGTESDDCEPIKILKEIFENRINICHNCNICHTK